MVELISPDGHRFAAYRADPLGGDGDGRCGAVVVLQEIFGVNHHIRNVCDRLAGLGYTALAPALFDRIAPGFESGYSPPEVAAARPLPARMNWEHMLVDLQTAIDALEAPVAVVGFCMGGSLAYLAATRLRGLTSAVAYYGGKIKDHADETPRVPVLMHFGETDPHIPLADAHEIARRRPDCVVHTYPAGHGFNCDERGSYDAACAAQSWQRTLAWLAAPSLRAEPTGSQADLPR